MMPVAMIKAVMVLMRMMLNKEEGEEIMNLEKVEGETLLLFQSTGFSFIGKNSNPDKYRSSIHLNLIQTYCDDSFHKQMRWNDPKLFSWMLSRHRNASINKNLFKVFRGATTKISQERKLRKCHSARQINALFQILTLTLFKWVERMHYILTPRC